MTTKHIYAVQCSVSICHTPPISTKLSVHQFPFTQSPTFPCQNSLFWTDVVSLHSEQHKVLSILKPFTSKPKNTTDQILMSSKKSVIAWKTQVEKNKPIKSLTVSWFNLAAGNYALDSHSLTFSLSPHRHEEENGQKVKLVRWDKDSLIRQQRKYYY